jgi:hypothetical protein
MKWKQFFFSMVMLAAFSCWASSGYDDLTKLLKSKTNEDVIISFINSSGASFAFTSDQIIQLKAMGASDKVIVAALRRANPDNNSVASATKSGAVAVPSKEAAPAGQQTTAPPDPNVVYEAVPSSGGWVLVNDYWYWQYPTGVIVDLGWQPFYFYHDRWFPRGHRRW